jgi:hypothetical protein
VKSTTLESSPSSTSQDGSSNDRSISVGVNGSDNGTLVFFLFVGEGSDDGSASAAERFLVTRFAAFKTCFDSLSSAKMPWIVWRSAFDMAEALPKPYK